MAKNKYVIQKLNPPPKVETDERGLEFITDPDTGLDLYCSGIAANPAEAVAWLMEKRETERLKEKYPGATFLERNA
ncbi:MAG: hypothetical protein ABIP82_00170 [Nitrospirales bacterium]